MRRMCVMAALLIAFAASTMAQTSHGYAFFAPGGVTSGSNTSMTLNFGFGGEARILPHLGAGAELAALGPREYFVDGVMGVLSPNAYVHINGRTEAKVDPFFTGGYTLMFRSGHENLVNFGGGVNVWAGRHLGFQLEVRDHVSTHYQTIHFWGFRFGLAFR